MSKKIIWIVLTGIVFFGVIYLKLIFPESQLDLRNSFQHVDSDSIDYYYNAPEKSCGIWYERTGIDGVYSSKQNEKVKKCFQEAFNKCENKNIMSIVDKGLTEEKKVIYSFIKVLQSNDQEECIIQNFYDEQYLNINSEPSESITFVNTCTELDQDIYTSCEPEFTREARKNRQLRDETKQEELESEEQELKTE